MRILITGATGFIGGYLAESLINDGHNVKTLVRKDSNLAVLNNIGADIVYGDITDFENVYKSVNNCDLIFHLAALTSHHKASKKDYINVNINGTKNILRASAHHSTNKVVYCSSAGIFGMIEKPYVDESSKAYPNSPYRETKLLAEKEALEYHRQNKLPVVSARIGSVYGPRSVSWLSLFKSINNKKFRMLGNGNNLTTLCYISDTVAGLKLCAEKGIGGESYLLTGGNPVKFRELVKLIANKLGVEVEHSKLPAFPFYLFQKLCNYIYIRFGYYLPRINDYEIFFSNMVYSISKAKNHLGFEPKVSLTDGINKTIKWYKEQDLI